MFSRASASLVICAFLTRSLVLVGSTEIRHTDADLVVKEETTLTQHRLVKRQVHRNMLGFNKEQRHAILQRHNHLRSQPRASNMMRMSWDTDLEKTAQTWAEQCVFKHSPGRDKATRYSYIGENLYAGTGEFDPADVVQAWYDEVKHYNYQTLACKANEQCGHYTQIVWASSQAVGCSVKYCDYLQEAEKFGFNSGYNYVCHYGPGGNYIGQKPYKEGEACSSCPKETPFCVRGLCALRPLIGSRGSWIQNTKSTSGLLFISFVTFHLVFS